MTWATLGRGRLAFALLMLPAVIYVLTWRLAPALYTVWLSLTQYNIVYDAAPQLNHLENYRSILHDDTLGEALRLSVIFAVLATAVELVIGLAAASLYASDPPARNLLPSIILLPLRVLPRVTGIRVVAGGWRRSDAFLELDKVIVMTGGRPGTSTQLVSMYVYKQAFHAYDLGYASTVITTLLALLAVAYAFCLRHYGRTLMSART